MDPVIIVLISLLSSAFFSGIEIAFVSANRLQIELESSKGNINAKIISWFNNQKANFVAALLVGNNIALVVYGIVMGEIIIQLFYGVTDIQQAPHQSLALIVQTVISTLIILFTAEFLPKTLFRINPNWILNLFAIPLIILYFILFVPAYIVSLISRVILKIFFKTEFNEDQPVFGLVDLDHFVKDKANRHQDEQEETDHEIQIFQNALDFSKVKARECMVPRNEIVAVDIEEQVSVLKQKFVESGLSKILVYRDNIDHVIGYVHSNELFKVPERIKSILWPIIILPETISAYDILQHFIQNKRNVAVIVDEFGGTAGMITIEDVVEQIFGDIEDEHDQEDWLAKKLSDTEFLFSARHEVDYINDKYELDLPDSDNYESLAGLILHHHENIPEKDSLIQIGKFKFKIIKVSENKIETILLKVTPD